jgi:nitrous oxidase accessory protein
MSVRTVTPMREPKVGAVEADGREPGPTARVIAGVIAAALLILALPRPVWEARLSAPQYPAGLSLSAYGGRVQGDIREITELNHYVGMRPYDPADLPEMRLWVPTLIAALGAVAVSTIFGRRLWGRLARLFVWGIPVGILGVIQLRLYEYGHDLVIEPRPALHLDPFIPWVVGRTEVLNFTTIAFPGAAVFLILAAAAVLSFGPGVPTTLRRVSNWMRQPVAGVLAVLTTLLVVAAPAAAGAEAGLPHRSSAEIQERIDAASPGAVIAIEPGMYHGNLVVYRAVTLEASGHVLIHGDGAGTVILVTGDGATIRGVHVENSGEGPVGGPAGIRVEADDVTIDDVLVTDTYMGIAVYGGRGVSLVDNTIVGRSGAVISDETHATSEAGGTGDHVAMGGMTGIVGMTGAGPMLGGRALRGDAITLWNTRDTLVRGNVVEHARDGIYLSFGRDVMIDSNRVLDSRYAVHNMYVRDLTIAENTFEANLSGAVLMYGGPVLLLRNQIEGSSSLSTGFAILLKDVFGCEAVENVLVGNRIGIQIDGPAGDTRHPVLVHGNTIALNAYGASLYPSAHATFYRNSFVENTVQVVAQGEGVAGKNAWFHEGVGNYWSDYRGYDLGGEGLGDVAHHEGGSVESLMVRAPVLQALASGPAFSLLRAVEDRWVEHRWVVIDPMPLMQAHSPALEDGVTGGSAPAVLAGAALVTLALAGAALVALRRPLRRGRTSHGA